LVIEGVNKVHAAVFHSNNGGSKYGFQVGSDPAFDVDRKFRSLGMDAGGKDFNRDIEETILDLAPDGAKVPDGTVPRSTPVANLHQEDDIFARELFGRGKVEKRSSIRAQGLV
jgi:hypothetical protein